MQYSNPDDPVSRFPRVIFPWFKDGTKTYNNHLYEIYRTSFYSILSNFMILSLEMEVTMPSKMNLDNHIEAQLMTMWVYSCVEAQP